MKNTDVAAGWWLEHETEISVDDVSLGIDHDVSIVPVFDLQKESD